MWWCFEGAQEQLQKRERKDNGEHVGQTDGRTRGFMRNIHEHPFNGVASINFGSGEHNASKEVMDSIVISSVGSGVS